MANHHARNVKTAMMFAVVMAFLIFAGTIFQLISNLLLSQTETFMPTDLVVAGFRGNLISVSPNVELLHEANLANFLDEQRSLDGAILSYGFVTAPLC